MLLPQSRYAVRVIQFLENQQIQIRIAVDCCADQETKIGPDLFIFIIQTQIAGSGW